MSLIIANAGDGNDTVFVDNSDVAQGSVIDGGSGDDRIFVGSLGNGTYIGGNGSYLANFSNNIWNSLIGFETYFVAGYYGIVDKPLDQADGIYLTAFPRYLSESGAPITDVVFSDSNFIGVTSSQISIYTGDGLRIRAEDVSAGSLNVSSLRGSISFSGGAMDDQIIGMDGNFDDICEGNGGNDYFDGGDGTDIAIYSGNFSDYTITEITYNTFEIKDNSAGSPDGTDTIIDVNKLRFADGDQNVVIAGLNIVGDDSAEEIDGGSSADYIDGAGGNDVVNGEGGNDDLAGGNGNDSINGGQGNDFMDGGQGSDNLNGGLGNDNMAGGQGNDTYVVDSTSDVVTEDSGTTNGVDLVQASVSCTISDADVENLTLTGSAAVNATGNESANNLTGNSAANTLNGGGGNDTLNGGAGTDAMSGGIGNDIYVVDSATDTITEVAAAGTDTVQTALTYSIASLANLENITLTGTSAVNATGNASVNTLTGNSGNNTLNGGLGNDSLIGGAGNDTYVVDNTRDVATEGLNAGTDAVQASVTYALGNHVENLTLTGTAAISGTGNTLNNVLTGNGAANILNGGAGNDNLNGGAGADVITGGRDADIFKVVSLSDSRLASMDRITDFVIGTDNIDSVRAVSAASTKEFGSVSTLNQSAIAAVLTNTVFGANQAATFKFGTRAFLALNDGTAGFSSTADAVIEITGFTGSLTFLAVV